MAAICTDTFTVTAVITLNCTLTIPDTHKNQRVAGHGTHILIIPFMYMVGTNPDSTHANYGFSIEPTDPSGIWPAGVTVSAVFTPLDPDLSGDATSMKNASVTVTIVVAESVTDRFSFGVSVILNTGVTP